MTASIRNDQASKSFFIYVVDQNTGKLRRTAIPCDLQVGLKNSPAELQVHGRLSVSSDAYVVTSASQGVVYVDPNDTIVNVDVDVVPASGRVSVMLPSNPRDGQLVIVKDASGTGASTPLDVVPDSTYHIDDAVSSSISVAYGTLGVYWYDNQWRTLFSLGTTVTSSGGGSSDGADRAASYLVISNTSSLPNERRLVAGANISISDGGAGGALTISATAGSGSGADPGASYVVIGLTSSLANERRLDAGTGISITDGGAGNGVSVGINNNVVATISGSTFTGPVVAQGGLSGSLQQLASGISYIIGIGSVTVTSQSNGQIIISGSGGGGSSSGGSGADVSASYITIGNTGSLPNERTLAVSSGLTLSDGGAGSSVTLGVNDNVVATLTGSIFSGPVSASGGLSGSLQQVAPGLSYLVAQGAISITSQSNGQIIISGSGGGGGGSSTTVVTASYRRYVRYHDTTYSPVALWQLSGSLVDDVNANNMSVYAGTEVYTSIYPGMLGAWLDGSTTLYTAASTSTMLITGSLTVEFIMVPTRFVTSDQAIIRESGDAAVDSAASNNLWAVNMASTTGRLQYSAEYSGGTNITHTTTVCPTLGVPIHFALVRNESATAVSYYVNGRLVATGSGLTAPDYSAPSIRTMIGGAWSATNGYWQGAIASVKVLSSSLTADQVNREFEYTLGPLYGVLNNETADVSASYIVIGATGSLPNERTLVVGSGLTLSDGGAGSSVTVGINDGIIATLTGSTFTGPISASGGLSGSLQQVAPGLSYLVAQGAISITSQSNGQIIISGSGGSGGGGSDSTTVVTASIRRYARYHDTAYEPVGLWQFSGSLVDQINASNLTAAAGTALYSQITPDVMGLYFNGSTRLESAASVSTLLITGALTVECLAVLSRQGSSTQGIVTLGSNAESLASNVLYGWRLTTDNAFQYLAERDAGTNIGPYSTTGSVQLGTLCHLAMVRGDDSQVTFYVNGSQIGATSTGLSSPNTSGGTQKLFVGSVDDGSFLLNATIASLKIISSALTPAQVRREFEYTLGPLYGVLNNETADVSASYIVIGATGSLPNERSLAVSSGLTLSDGGAGSAVTLGVNDNVVATLTGSTFTGPVSASGGLSGSLQQVAPGLSYLVAAGNITITSQSNGQIIISGSGGSGSSPSGSGADVSASYIVIGATGSLPNERVLSGSGISITDNGAGSTVVLSVQKTGSLPRYHDTTYSPVGLWQFSGNLSDSVNSNTLTVAQGSERYGMLAPGVMGHYFNGSTRLDTSAAPSVLLITGALTIECLVVPTRQNTADQYMITMTESGESLATNTLFHLGLTTSNDLFYGAETAAGTNIGNYTITGSLVPGVLCHLAMVRGSDSQVTFYVNGSKIGSSSSGLATPAYSAPTQKLMIGNVIGSSVFFQGAIASLKIISSSLTPDQVYREFMYTLGPLHGY